MAKVKQRSDLELGVELIRIQERGRNLRWTISGAVIATCIWKIVDGVVAVANQPKPGWVSLIIAIVGAIGVGFGPSAFAIAWIKRVISKRLTRLSKLEKESDPQRTSSGIRTDGTDPND